MFARAETEHKKIHEYWFRALFHTHTHTHTHTHPYTHTTGSIREVDTGLLITSNLTQIHMLHTQKQNVNYPNICPGDIN